MTGAADGLEAASAGPTLEADASRSVSSSILRRGGGIILVRVVGFAATLGVQVLVARAVGIPGFGVFSYATAVLLLVLVPAKLGTEVGAVRAVAEHSGTTELKAYVVLATLAVSIASVLVAGLWVAFEVGTGWSGLDDDRLTLVAFAATVLPLAQIRLAEGVLRGAHRVVVAYVPFAVAWPAGTALVLGGMWASGRDLAVVDVAVVQLGVGVVVALAAGWLSWSTLRPRWGSGRRFGELWRRHAREWGGTAYRLTLVTTFTLVLGQSDIVLLGLISNEADVATYSAAWRVAASAGGFLIAFNFAFAPVAAQYWVERDLDALQRVIDRTMSIVVPASLVVTAGLGVTAPLVLAVFGSGYTEADLVLRILLVGQLVNAAFGPVALLLNVTGHERVVVRVLGVTAALNLALNLVLFQLLGSTGVALGTVVAGAIWNVVLVRFVERDLGVRVFRPRVWAHTLSGLVRSRLGARPAAPPGGP